MMYTLDDLLKKMGAPEAKEKGQIRWHYFDKKNEELGGFAEVRLIDGGAALIAEVRHMCEESREEAIGASASSGFSNETLYLHARRIHGDGPNARYEVTKMAFDGEEYSRPQKSVVELGLSLFHARALNISIRMIEHAFNKEDIMQLPSDDQAQFKDVPIRLKRAPEKKPEAESWGVVLPFRPRGVANGNLPGVSH